MPEAEVLSEVTGALNVYHKMAIRLHATLITFGSLAIICSLIITAFVGEQWLYQGLIRLLSFFSTLFLTLITAFNLSAKGNNARKAWRHLNNAFLEYHAGGIDLKKLAHAKKESDDILGYVDFNTAATKSKSKDLAAEHV